MSGVMYIHIYMIPGNQDANCPLSLDIEPMMFLTVVLSIFRISLMVRVPFQDDTTNFCKELETQIHSFPHQDENYPISLDIDTWKFLRVVLSI